MKKFTNYLIRFFGICFFIFAVWIVIREGQKVGWLNLWHIILSTPMWLLAIVFGLLICDYAILSGYDILALKYLKKKVPYSLILKANTTGFAIGNTIGHTYISGGALRYLFYFKHGLSRIKIMMLIAFETIMFCLGLMTTYIIAILLLPWTILDLSKLHLSVLYGSGILVFLALFFYILCVFKFHKKMCICKTKLATPTPKITFAEIMISCLDNLFLNLIFFILLRYHFDISFINSFVVCVIAMTVSMCMQSPGGLGVFEGLVLLMLPHSLNQTVSIMAGLALFRVMYFFVPFIIACLYLFGYWILEKRKSPS